VESTWLITQGLSAKEKVVYEGLQKVTDGAKVTPKIVSPSSTKEQQ
jgi:hypothetical protein